MRRLSIYFLLAIPFFVLVIIMGKSYFFPTIPEFSGLLPPPDTILYKNEKYDFEFRYPKEWQIVLEDDDDIVFRSPEYASKMEVNIIPFDYFNALPMTQFGVRYPYLLAIAAPEQGENSFERKSIWLSSIKKIYREEREKDTILYNWFEVYPEEFVRNNEQKILGQEIFEGIYLLKGQEYPQGVVTLRRRDPSSFPLIPEEHHESFDSAAWMIAFSTPGIEENVTLIIATGDYLVDINVRGEETVAEENESGIIYKTFLPQTKGFYGQLSYNKKILPHVVNGNRLNGGLQLLLVLIGVGAELWIFKKAKWKTLIIFSSLFMLLYVFRFTYQEVFRVNCQNVCWADASTFNSILFFAPGIIILFIALMSGTWHLVKDKSILEKMGRILLALISLIPPGILFAWMIALAELGGLGG